MFRTHTLTELSLDHVGNTVTLSGFVNRRRDHGGLIFIDLRDRYGVTQIVFDPSDHEDAHKLAESLRGEFVIKVKGLVRKRPDGMSNSKLPTGEIEVLVSSLEILSEAQTPPFEIDSDDVVNEELNLYRMLTAASNGDINSIRAIYAKGYDLNVGDYDGRTALHLAASEGELEIVEFLISKKVNKMTKDRWANTALDDAMREKEHCSNSLRDKYEKIITLLQ